MSPLNLKFLILSTVFLVSTYITLQSQKAGQTFVFNYVHEGVIDSSWQNLTDTCELTFAKRQFFRGKRLQELLSAGDKVMVKIGYDGELVEEFAGYLTRYNAKAPLTMFFEDNMYILKKDSITKNFGSKATLKQVVEHIASHYNSKFGAGITAVVEDVQLGSFSVKDLSGAKILEKIQSMYGIYSYFRANKLYSGLAYQVKDASINTVRFRFNYNIITDNLEYRVANDIKLRVKGISMALNNKKTIAYAGDEDGEVHTLHLPIGMDQAAVKKLAEAEASRMRFDGYRGSFIGFHRPIVRHGDIAQISDDDYPEREGRFLVDRVVTRFGVNGIRRIIQPGIKA